MSRKIIKSTLILFGLVTLLIAAVELIPKNFSIFNHESAIKGKSEISEVVNKGKEDTKVSDIMSSVTYSYDYEQDSRTVTFSVKNTSDKDITLTYPTKSYFDVELTNHSNEFFWELSKTEYAISNQNQVVIKAGDTQKNAVTLPETIPASTYLIKVFSTASELKDKETTVGKIEIKDQLTEVNSDFHSATDTQTNVSEGIVTDINYDKSSNVLKITLANATGMPKELHFEENEQCVVSVYNKTILVAKIQFKGDNTLVIPADDKVVLSKKLTLNSGNYKLVLQVSSDEPFDKNEKVVTVK